MQIIGYSLSECSWILTLENGGTESFYVPDTIVKRPAISRNSGILLSEDNGQHQRFISKKELQRMGFATILAAETQFDNNKASCVPAGGGGGAVSEVEFLESSSEPSPALGKLYFDDGTNTGGTPLLRYNNGLGFIDITGTVASYTPDHVLVTNVNDFPAPSGGVITLAADTVYRLSGDVTVSDSIDLNNSAIIGDSFRVDSLTFDGIAGSMFTGTEGGHLENLTLAANGGGTATMFNLNGSASKAFQCRFCQIIQSDLGTVQGGYNVFQFFFCAFAANSGGISITDGNIVNYHSSAWFANNTAPTYITLLGDITTVQWLGGNLDIPSGQTGLDITGLNSVGRGNISGGSAFLGDGTYVDGTFDSSWEVEAFGLGTLKDSEAEGSLYISTSGATSFVSINTPVKVNANTTLASNVFRFDDDGAVSNRLRYTGLKTQNFNVSAHISSTAAANNRTYTWYIAKNGTIVTESAIQRKQGTGSDVGALGLSWNVELAENDYVEIWVENNTDTVDVTANFMTLSVAA